MNDHLDPDSTSPTERRLRSHLHDVAERATVPASTPGAAHRRARARTIRRRRAVAGGLAAASIVGVVVGVRALSEPRPSSIRTIDTPTVEVDDQLAPGTGPSGDGGSPAAGDDRIQATTTEPAFVWKVVEPDKDRAVTGTFAEGSADTFPALALSTAPGRSNDYDNIERVLWATDDGIEWEQQAELSSPFGISFWEPTMVGGNVFAVGTAPGIAATDVSPLLVAVNSVDGGDWATVDLPLDTNAHSGVPVAHSEMRVARIPLDDSFMLAVTPEVYVDYRAVARRQGIDLDDLRIYEETDSGVVVVDDECVDDITVATTAALNAAGGPPTTTRSDEEPEACSLSERTWAELGVPDETIDAMASRSTRIFIVDVDLSVREIESPVPGAVLEPFDYASPTFALRGARDTYIDGERPTSVEVYEYDGVNWTASQLPVRTWTNGPVPVGDDLVGFTRDPNGLSFTIVGSDGVTSQTDVAPLFEEDTLLDEGFPRGAVAAGHLVSVVAQSPDLIARAGGAELTVDGVTARKDAAAAPVYFVDAATGERIEDERIRYRDPDAEATAIEVAIVDGDGETIAEFTQRQILVDLESALYEEHGPVPTMSSLVTTADGVSFSVESVADLLGVEQDAVSHVQRVSTDGNTVVVAVATNERHPDDSPKQLVLVGTPIG